MDRWVIRSNVANPTSDVTNDEEPQGPSRNIRSLDDIIDDYDTWKLRIPDNVHTKSTSKQHKWNATYLPKWKKEYPWISEVVVNQCVVGILCSLCREPENFNSPEGQLQRKRSTGLFVTKPFTKMGDFYEQAREHEFGITKSIDPLKYRQKIKDGVVQVPSTAHTTFHLRANTRTHAAATFGNICNAVNTMSMDVCKANERAMIQLCALVHRSVKQRSSPFQNLKDNVLFLVQQVDCHSLKPLLRVKTGKQSGISNRKIKEIFTAIYQLTILGMYVEMKTGLDEEEATIFGGTIDLGSKTKKTKEYAGVGARYLALGEKSVVTRVIGFRRCTRKTGLALITVMKETLQHFNDTVKQCQTMLGRLFPMGRDTRIHKIQLENMESLGVDGALISDVKMVNKWVLEFNPRCLVHWCGGHRTNKVSEDVLKESERHTTVHTIITKLHDLVNASMRFEDLFQQCQISTMENEQFKGNKPVVLCDRPMHRWESTLKFYLKLEKVLLSVETFLAEIEEQGLAKDAKQNTIYPAHFIKKKFIMEEFLVTMATEMDALEILVRFTKLTEYTDHDMALFLEQIEDVRNNLRSLIRRPGKHFIKMKERLLHGDLKNWHNMDINQMDDNDFEKLYQESINLYVEKWDERFADRKGELKMFLLFSLTMFKRDVYNADSVEEFGLEYEELLANYCEEKEFTAKYDEAKNETFISPPFGTKETLYHEIQQMKRYIFRNFFNKINKDTQKDWTSKDMLTSMLTSEDPSVLEWLSVNGVLRKVMRIALIQMTMSSDVERLFSVFTLYDNKLNQGATPTEVEEVMVIMKESPDSKYFDSQAALTLWRKAKDTRQISLSSEVLMKKLHATGDKTWVKTVKMLHEISNKRKLLFEKSVQYQLSTRRR